VLLHSPVAIVLYAIAATALLLPAYLRFRGKGQALARMAADED
jgi:putative tricarboxylic transport membrane protein